MTESTNLNSFLIADDSSTARMIIRQCIEIAGFHGKEFLEARDGKEAWQILQHHRVDMVFTDLNMPELDGRALLKLIKSMPELSSTCVIVITSTKNPAKEAELRDLGASSVLDKPVSPASIYQTLTAFTRNDSEMKNEHMSVDLTRKLRQALIEVVADLSFICLMEQPGGDLPPDTGRQLHAMMPVHQPFEEKFLLTLESRLLNEMTCNIYGLKAEQLTKEHQMDTLSELLNTIAGRLMQILVPPSIQFELGLPVLDIDDTISNESALNLVFNSDEGYLVFSLIGSNLNSEVRK